ncbi:MAG: AAA family ATPase [Candidatus Pacebacteria bacterium]|nr:AAA family ATPase [Candidatus Paceibacterota bacterium]
MKLVLLGIQGAGKSTQGKLLSKELKLPYLSSGHIFREMAKKRTKRGRWLKETLNAGVLVPDDTTVEIVLEYLEKSEYQKGFIIDGFPRTLAQAEAFANGEIAIFIDVSDKEALWRISGRTDAREDETLQAIRQRIQLFHEHTAPVLEFYKKQGKLIKVNGEKTVEQVYEQIVKKLTKLQKRLKKQQQK